MSLKTLCLTGALVAFAFTAQAVSENTKDNTEVKNSVQEVNSKNAVSLDSEVTVDKKEAKTASKELSDPVADETTEDNVFEVGVADENVTVYPCPFGWSVIPNPSVDNSLTYENANSSLIISVTTLKQGAANDAGPEAYARVAAEQMNCKLPSNSNLIEDAFTFDCPFEGVEAIVYGEPGELVLLVISGRNKDTEAELENFVKFLAFEAQNRQF